jgi:hypothetical protein
MRLDKIKTERDTQLIIRAIETPQQKRIRYEDQRVRQGISRELDWKFMEGEVFRYHPTRKYGNHP